MGIPGKLRICNAAGSNRIVPMAYLRGGFLRGCEVPNWLFEVVSWGKRAPTADNNRQPSVLVIVAE
jgi:hypothetical protein